MTIGERIRACRQRGVRLETTADTSLRAMQGALVT